MELPSRAGDGVEPSVVETVEVVSAGGGGDKVLSPGGTETTLKIIAPTQISVPLSTGVSFHHFPNIFTGAITLKRLYTTHLLFNEFIYN
jgi:hypothetical protein